MLIVLEGLDGAGKSTQVKMLREYLSSRCESLEYIHFPRYDAPVYGSLISRFLRGEFGSIDAVHPQLVALLFAEDRHGAAPALRKALEEGKTVLLDRYVYSNIAYQCSKLPEGEERNALRDWIFNTEYGPFGLPRPDLNLYLDVPISFVEKNLTEARNGEDRTYLAGSKDIHEGSIAFQRTVRSMYLAEVERDSSFLKVNCSGADGSMLPPDDIFTRLRAAVDPYLK